MHADIDGQTMWFPSVIQQIIKSVYSVSHTCVFVTLVTIRAEQAQGIIERGRVKLAMASSVPESLKSAGAINSSQHNTLLDLGQQKQAPSTTTEDNVEHPLGNPTSKELSATTLNAPPPANGDEKGRIVEDDVRDEVDKDEILEPTISVWSGTGLVIGLMIGSGIFATPGKVIRSVGSIGVALMLWVLGGIFTFCGTFSYIEMGVMLPRSGGEQAYLDVAFRTPRAFVSFLFCWASIFCIRPGSIAAEGSVIGRYIQFAYFGSDIGDPNTARYIGLGALTIIAIITSLSSKWAIRIHDVFVGIKVMTLVLISITGIVVASGGTKVPLSGNFNNAWTNTSNNGGAYAHALFQIFWSYDGWNNLNYATSELINPRKNLPIAATTGITIVTILYILANISYIAVVPLATILQGNAVLAAQWGTLVFGNTFGGQVLPALVAISTFGAAMASTFSGSRVLHITARAGYLPFGKTLSHLNRVTHTPVNALIMNWIMVVILLMAPPVGPIFDFLLDLVGYPAYVPLPPWVFYTLSVIGLIVMRKTMADVIRPFKVWLPVAYFFLIAGFFQFVMPFVPYGTSEYPYYLPPVVGWCFMLSGIPAYFAFVYWKEDASLDLKYS
ncbi:hypothetical protein SmJEL517_g02785 [Synchytrium microbalum]|uniref:Amino acid permease/ SLC12A domain-containing protein n=1 Tax=Synchytrium microbalum TaxID=1806994 RepID=A0A507C9P1_9FUNG|nr:uncharacterized protein SmJEL517_g02785 [Synchytrium microbalum]TPX34694.1 hypothetical protein SmJEL517_g02785 [Synchytrium microbalum]